MTDRSVTHATFTITRDFSAPLERVFAAFADPAVKVQWFGGPDAHELDFRAGGTERTAGNVEGKVIAFTSTYHEIVANARIVYSSVMTMDDEVTTVSLTSVEFASSGEGTTLQLTEHGAYLDGHELPEWREGGTNEQIDKLAKLLDM